MFKVLQARLQQYMNHEIPDVQDGFNKGRGTKIQISNMCGLIKIKRELQKKKKIYFLFIVYIIKLVMLSNHSSSVILFSSCPQSFSASGSFPLSHFFASGGQSIWVSASISVLPMNAQDWSLLGWTGWIPLQSKGLSRVFSNTTVQKHQFLVLSFLYSPNNTSIHDYWKTIESTRQTFWQTNMSAF